MNPKYRFALVLCSLSISVALIALGAQTFMSGFLPRRSSFTDEAASVPALPAGVNQTRPVVLILLDGVRFDRVSSCSTDAIGRDTRSQSVFHFPCAHRHLRKSHANTRGLLVRTEADPPTTTRQRIQAMMSGSLPVFAEWASALDESESDASGSEVLSSAGVLGRSNNPVHPVCVVAGDPLWPQLYPGRFSFALGARGLDVRDTDSADAAATWLLSFITREAGLNQTPSEMHRAFEDALFVGDGHDDDDNNNNNHSLGEGLLATDFGSPHHLAELYRRERVELLSKNEDGLNRPWGLAIAHFLGVDHTAHAYNLHSPFMSSKVAQIDQILVDFLSKVDENALVLIIGDHGTTEDGNHGGASPDEIFTFLYAFSKSGWPDTESENIMEEEYTRTIRTINQIDIAPTLAFLLGTDIPWGSLGNPISELLSTSHNRGEYKRHSDINAIKNSYLVTNYTHNYMMYQVEERKKSSEWIPNSQDLVKKLESMKQQLDSHMSVILSSNATNEESSSDIRTQFLLDEYHRSALNLARMYWSTFQIKPMILGLAFVATGIFGAIASINLSESFTTVYSIRMGGYNLVPIVIWLLRCTAIFSNSFILSEPYVLRFLSTSLCMIPVYGYMKQASSKRPLSEDDKLIFVSLATVLLCIRCLSLGEYSGTLGDHDIPKVVSKPIVELFLESISSKPPIKFLFQIVLPTLFYALAMKKKNDLRNTSTIPMLVSMLVVLVYYLIEMIQSTLSSHSYTKNSMDVIHLWLPRLLLLWIFVTKTFESIKKSMQSTKSVTPPNNTMLDSMVCRNILVDFFHKTGFVFPMLWIVGGPNSIFASITISVALVSFTEALVALQRRASLNHGHNDKPQPEYVAYLHYLSPEVHPSIHVWTVWWVLVIQYSFYSTTHAPVFGALQINRGMTGLFHFNFYVNGALLFANTWGFPVYFLVAFIHTTPKIFKRFPSRNGSSQITELIAPFLLVPYVASFWWCIALSCFLQRHHLMLWGVFAPRLVFASVEACWALAIVCTFALTKAVIIQTWISPRPEIKNN